MEIASPNLIQWDELDMAEVEHVIKRIANGRLSIADADAEMEPFTPEAIDEAGLQAYIDKYSLTSIRNGRLMIAWCREADVPCVLHNLEVARGELKAQGRWEIEPPAPEAPRVVARTIITSPIVAAQVARPSPEEAKFLKKVADNPLASDATRKKHDAELKRAAYAQRFANRKSVPTPTVVI